MIWNGLEKRNRRIYKELGSKGIIVEKIIADVSASFLNRTLRKWEFLKRRGRRWRDGVLINPDMCLQTIMGLQIITVASIFVSFKLSSCNFHFINKFTNFSKKHCGWCLGGLYRCKLSGTGRILLYPSRLSKGFYCTKVGPVLSGFLLNWVGPNMFGMLFPSIF